MKKKDPEGFKMRMLEAKSKGISVKFKKFWLAIPAISDFMISTLQYVALNFISGSVYQMIRGSSIVITLIFSVIFIKFKVMKNQLASAGLVIIGAMVAGLSNMVFKDQSGDGASAIIFFLFSGFANRRLLAHHSLFSRTDFCSCLSKNFCQSITLNHSKWSDTKECSD
jgi:drug/metabolite transporter (DMT)-like permease